MPDAHMSSYLFISWYQMPLFRYLVDDMFYGKFKKYGKLLIFIQICKGSVGL